jgi:Ni,Fe-hydrogenase I large subunit
MEAPRGAFGHLVEIEGHRIKNYQCVVHSFDPCLGCAVHVLDARKRGLARTDGVRTGFALP